MCFQGGPDIERACLYKGLDKVNPKMVHLISLLNL